MARMSMSSSRQLTVMAVIILAQILSQGVGMVEAATTTTTTTTTAPTRDYPFNWIRIHGWLMWASMGLLMPVGIILVRFSAQARQRGDLKTIRTLVYTHIFIQVVAVLACVCGAMVAVLKFDNNFHYTHERLGLALWILVWIAPLLGLVRPDHGKKNRPVWYALHWLFGTTGVVLGFYNIYTGLHAYELMSGKSLRTINILFSIQLGVMALVYFAQDRCQYLKAQGISKSTSVTAKSKTSDNNNGHIEVKTTVA